MGDVKIYPHSVDRDILIPKSKYLINRNDIPGYLTEDAFAQIKMWEEWHMWDKSMPFAGGYADQPARWRDIIEALEDENNYRSNSGKQK